MAPNTLPIFVLTPVCGIARIATANTGRDGSGTLGTLVTGGANGARIHKIIVKANGTTTAGRVTLFVTDGSGTHIWKEIAVSAIVPATGTSSFESVLSLFGEDALFLPSGLILKCGTTKAESFDVTALGGQY